MSAILTGEERKDPRKVLAHLQGLAREGQLHNPETLANAKAAVDALEMQQAHTAELAARRAAHEASLLSDQNAARAAAAGNPPAGLAEAQRHLAEAFEEFFDAVEHHCARFDEVVDTFSRLELIRGAHDPVSSEHPAVQEHDHVVMGQGLTPFYVRIAGVDYKRPDARAEALDAVQRAFWHRELKQISRYESVPPYNGPDAV